LVFLLALSDGFTAEAGRMRGGDNLLQEGDIFTAIGRKH